MKTHKQIGWNRRQWGTHCNIINLIRKLPLKVKCVSQVAIPKGFCSSGLVNFISESFSKIKLIAISIALDNWIFVNKLFTSNETKNLSATFTNLIFSINVNLSFVEYSYGT